MQDQDIKKFWNDRFAESDFAYGKEPNDYFKSVIDKLEPGRVFIPGAGEGRDAVYAATKGWDVYCLDLSESGKTKATKLADENGTTIKYVVGSISAADFPEGSFDLIGSTYFHLPEDIRKSFVANAIKWLKPGGYFVSELFTPAQLANTSGGPKDVSLLATKEQFAEDFKTLDIINNEETKVTLNEGQYHQGKANVVRFTGRKKPIQ